MFFWRDGTIYRGQFADDKMHGYGVKQRPDGAFELQNWHAGALGISKPLVAQENCRLTMDERGWMFNGDACVNGLAHGIGLAASLDGQLLVVNGRFVLGRMVDGDVQHLYGDGD